MQVAILMPQVMSYEKQEEEKYRDFMIRDFCNHNIDLRELGITFQDSDGRIVIACF